jgi:hypothetical protein
MLLLLATTRPAHAGIPWPPRAGALVRYQPISRS